MSIPLFPLRYKYFLPDAAVLIFSAKDFPAEQKKNRKILFSLPVPLSDHVPAVGSVVHVRHDRHMTCSLHCYSDGSLVLRAGSCHSSRQDLSTLRNIFFQFVRIFVVDDIVFSTENTYFSSSARTSSRCAFGSLALIKSHLLFLLLFYSICTFFSDSGILADNQISQYVVHDTHMSLDFCRTGAVCFKLNKIVEAFAHVLNFVS